MQCDRSAARVCDVQFEIASSDPPVRMDEFIQSLPAVAAVAEVPSACPGSYPAVVQMFAVADVDDGSRRRAELQNGKPDTFFLQTDSAAAPDFLDKLRKSGINVI